VPDKNRLTIADCRGSIEKPMTSRLVNRRSAMSWLSNLDFRIWIFEFGFSGATWQAGNSFQHS